jgi:choline-sulfatase
VKPELAAGGFARGREPLSVLFIMCDQHTARAISCYQNGFGGLPQPLTPNIDHIAEQGVRFERAYCAAPQCQPSRFSLLTGRWPHHHGLRFNETWEPRDQVTFPELARRQGCVTATIGKHHMAWPSQPPGFSDDMGFTFVVDLADYEQFCLAQSALPYDAPGQFWQVPQIPPALLQVGYTLNPNALHPAGYWADRTIEFLERRAPSAGGDGEPFVCWFSMEAPHPPILPTGTADPEDWAHLFQPSAALDLPPNLDKTATTSKLADLQQACAHVTDDKFREILSYYYGLIAQVDWNVGRVLDRLEELGLAERTVVVYTADHGEMGSEMSCWGKGSGFYEAVARVPLLVRLPGAIPPGQVVAEPVNAVDLFPTLLELTGVYASEGVRQKLDGRSLAGILLGDAAPALEPALAFSEFGTSELPEVMHGRMVRALDRKYTFDEINGGEEEFYDLALDPYELDNLIDAPDPEVQAAIEALRSQMQAWWGDEAAHAPEYKLMGDAALLPAAAADPLPPQGALDASRQVDPRWLPSTAANTQSVFFGTSPARLELCAELGPMESSFNPGTLAPGTAYWWRVDQTNAHGTAQGEVWTFTTELAGPGGPGLAAGPLPAQGAEGVGLSPVLSWSPPADALSQELFFGPAEGALASLGALPGDAGELAPAPLSAGVAYRWRVDTLSGEGVTEGTVWTFTTDPFGLSEPASGPIPAHLRSAAPAPIVLRWTPGHGALAHDVYFGTALPLELVASQPGPVFDPGPLAPGQTYYWRVDEVNAYGTTHGWTWRFTTAP